MTDKHDMDVVISALAYYASKPNYLGKSVDYPSIARDALPLARAMRERMPDGWLPMSEATKDGTPLLLAYHYPPDEAKTWCDEHHRECEQVILMHVGHWFRGNWCHGPDPMHPPLWFQPLPAPPQE